MSELDQSASGPPHDDASAARNEDFAGLLGDQPEREGLPRSYRMRADAHYVDALESRHEGPIVRVIPTRQIETADLPSSIGLTALAESISAHGILQPLLVRRHGGRYQLVAGRKRLAAALAAGKSEVPCVVHDVDEVSATALAEADNIRAIPQSPVQPPADAGCLYEVLQALSYDLAGMGSLVAFLRPAAGGLFQHQATADLLQAQTWRAAWLAGAVAIVASPYRAGRAKAVGSIVERVRAGLEAEARLTKLQLDLCVTPEAAKSTVDENLGSALAGMMLATLSWLRGSDEPRLEVRVDAPGPGSLRCQVVQRVAPVPEEAAEYLRAPGSSRPGDLTTTIGLLTARTFAAEYSGTLEITAIGRRGSVIQSVFSLDC